MAGNSPTLNTEQKKAVLATDGPLLILAGAGAGKTKTITERIIHLIDSGVPEERILAVTFTNKAAKEMRDRVFSRIGSAAKDERFPFSLYEKNAGPLVVTFHVLSVRIIREFGNILGIRKRFSILDRDDQIKIIKRTMKEVGLDPTTWNPRSIISFISKQKGLGLTYADFRQNVKPSTFVKIIDPVWRLYEEENKKTHALDFDDLILNALILVRRPEVQKLLSSRFQYIHVDEYQDTNHAQYELAYELSKKHKNICVVGDIDQSIYTWRGADFTNITRFEEDFPKAHVITLTENYRSTKHIIAASNEVIEKNKKRKEKTLFTNNKEGEKIAVYISKNEQHEGQTIAQKIEKIIEGGQSPDDIAILYRANFQSRVLEEAMLTYNIPHQVLGTRFFERKEIKDMLAYCLAAENPEDLASISRIINVPARGIGKVTLAKIAGGQKDLLSGSLLQKVNAFYELLSEIQDMIGKERPAELLSFILAKSGLQKHLQKGSADDIERLENIKELVTLSKKYDALDPQDAYEQLITDAQLVKSDQDEIKKDAGVKLMTVHAAKGLEFSHVFITGLEEDLFPHVVISEDTDPEEERRLFYVALTRAKERVYLSYANTRTIFGKEEVRLPSSFIFDIDEHHIEEEEPLPIINIS